MYYGLCGDMCVLWYACVDVYDYVYDCMCVCYIHDSQESGVLQRDRLRGTVGYMSPELILAGVSSRATDVWAAGVVLYILLCGRPPFQSKSNRQVVQRLRS